VIEAEKASYRITRMCKLLEVSRSGFYKWRTSRDAGPTPAQRRRRELDTKIAAFHRASDGVYGAPRILADLHADGERVSRKMVAASLRHKGLAGISPRQGDGPACSVDHRHRATGVLRRSAQPLAARNEREHQRAAAAILSERGGPSSME
jgi:putative transposase